jgi:hypothetical protein
MLNSVAGLLTTIVNVSQSCNSCVVFYCSFIILTLFVTQVETAQKGVFSITAKVTAM